MSNPFVSLRIGHFVGSRCMLVIINVEATPFPIANDIHIYLEYVIMNTLPDMTMVPDNVGQVISASV